MNLSGCTALSSLSCANSALTDLSIDQCDSLQVVNCGGNYLNVEDGSPLNQALHQLGLNSGLVNYENQYREAGQEAFEPHEREVLLSFLSTGRNAEVLDWDWNWPGTWTGISWGLQNGVYRVQKVDLARLSVSGTLDLRLKRLIPLLPRQTRKSQEH